MLFWENGFLPSDFNEYTVEKIPDTVDYLKPGMKKSTKWVLSVVIPIILLLIFLIIMGVLFAKGVFSSSSGKYTVEETN